MTSPKQTNSVERRTGVALWRQIADRIRLEITADLADETGKMPPEIALAKRFGVNRHTIRAAIAALAQEGVLRAEQGRGTFVIRRNRLAYPITKRTRFSAGLQNQTKSRSRNLLQAETETATAEIAEALGLNPDAKVIRIETLSQADGTPISRSSSWFDAIRFAGIEKHFEKTGSFTAALAAYDITDYIRAATTIDARHASTEDTRDLGLSPGAIVLMTRAIDSDLSGHPLQYAITRFAADRIELCIENSL